MGERRLITVAEAAALLGVTPRRVRKFIEEGRLQGEPVNPRLWLVYRSSVERFARAPRRGGRPKAKRDEGR